MYPIPAGICETCEHNNSEKGKYHCLDCINQEIPVSYIKKTHDNWCESCKNYKNFECFSCVGALYTDKNGEQTCVRKPSHYEETEKIEKPPLGLEPRRVHDYSRVKEIVAAMQRYIDADKPIPSVWAEELWDILSNYEE